MIAPHAAHVAPNPHHYTTAQIHAAKVRQANSTKFDFWNPWKSIKKVFKK